MTTKTDIVATVRSYCGTPYVHQGRVSGVGMDCPAPIILAARAHGLVSPDFDINGYGAMPDGKTLLEWCDKHMTRTSNPEPGDVIVVHFKSGRPQHLGVLTDNTPGRSYWVHAEGLAHKEVRETRLDFGSRAMRLVAAYSLL
jgi:cell wall-associated NlpC family hydrolase